MSLIYSAISSLEKKQAAEGMAAEPRISRPAPQPIQGNPARWIYAAGIGSVAAVVIGGAALAVLRERSREVPPPLAASAPSVAAPAPQTAAPLPVQQAVSAPLQQAGAPAAPAPPTAAPAPVALAKPVEQAAKSAPAQHQAVEKAALPAVPPAATRAARRAQPAPVAALVNEPAPTKLAADDLNRLAMAAKQAIDSGNQDQAETLLGQLAANLPPESITLLRLRAWQALRKDDQPQAMTLYGQIVERLPEDESASINLAVLNWKAGRRDEARRIVATLAERRPDSDTVRRYLVQFGERN